MNTKPITKLLSEVELFQGIAEQDLALFAEHVQYQELKARDILFRTNDLTDALYVIASGSIQLFDDQGERERSLTVFSNHEFIGETILIAPPHKQGVCARLLSDGVLYQFEREVLHDLLSQRGDLALKISATISQIIIRRMEHANSRYKNISALYQARGRRIEHDLLGEKTVPETAYYGIQTLRALENFSISGITLNFYPDFIKGLAKVKKAAAMANHELGHIPDNIIDPICQACDEIGMGMLHNHFIVDMLQGGAGTSTNMNANEVIANRTLEILGHRRGDYQYCHPNNHINYSQSTNDAYPTAIKVALMDANDKLLVEVHKLIMLIDDKTFEFSDILKMGRTQLQDAVPMTLGQSFNTYATSLRNEIKRLKTCSQSFLTVNMGGTAIGTGLNADPRYRERVVQHLSKVTERDIVLADDLIEATHDTGPLVMYSSALKQLAVKLSKICNDLRLLSSGPRAGLNEINLPPMQPGSSIMPGKVNPVIPEVVNQIAFKVIGNDLTTTLGAEAGQLELNVMEPVMVESLFESIEILKRGMHTLGSRCIAGITANEAVCADNVKNSIGIVTALNPHLGYEVCTALAKQALEHNRSVYDLVLEQRLLSKEQLDDVLAPENMVR
ncbi:MAG: Aspartate ammonia-lyase (EC [uncultured Thiotrichaceae bacterium]|uniref:Aspartate ammonia-lyase n=1 Tax=uncultured Thiotrichaceae bacterium TaxID=298394 RepID=A0A6S6SUB3_9GAMM|nr:MAG: Aspartate ammonia-lyase (EC [uncultured Thiotrichaceae bacterium]